MFFHSYAFPWPTSCSGGNIAFMITLLLFRNQYCWVGTKKLLNSHQTLSLVRGRGLGTRLLITCTNLFNDYKQWQGSRKQEVSRPLSDDWERWWKNFCSSCGFSAVSQLLVWRCLDTKCLQCRTSCLSRETILLVEDYVCLLVYRQVSGLNDVACILKAKLLFSTKYGCPVK